MVSLSQEREMVRKCVENHRLCVSTFRKKEKEVVGKKCYCFKASLGGDFSPGWLSTGDSMSCHEATLA